MNEKTFIEINGMRQGMFIQGESAEKPVLLFLHGGPGSPEAPFTQSLPTGLGELFTVCWWEQRGSGMTYRKDTPPDTMTIEQMVDDALAMIGYLRERFGKEKLYVMGHSWGSLLGVLVAQRAPELLHAYIGIGQLARQDESERLAYAYMLDRFREAGDKRMLRRLEKHPIDQGAAIDFEYLSVRSSGMTKLGIGMVHRWRSMVKPVLAVLRFKGYTMREKMNYPRGNAFSLNCLWDEVLGIDLFERVPRLEVPVYVFHGVFDYQVSYAIAKEYLQVLEAPVKGFCSFEESAHSPCFEEPEKMCRILREDVLAKAAVSDGCVRQKQRG
ncbi:alpha/beta fold hydrolase [Raoultibacter timonensis]|uniref:alpha/beta fold hydrolase n=1 Tax=Raoultibacter timonensis TaxID=1907662 RepID=UPI001C64136E|nr:alpha/beta hydrolase [Raoultibacter timonensis]